MLVQKGKDVEAKLGLVSSEVESVQKAIQDSRDAVREEQDREFRRNNIVEEFLSRLRFWSFLLDTYNANRQPLHTGLWGKRFFGLKYTSVFTESRKVM